MVVADACSAAAVVLSTVVVSHLWLCEFMFTPTAAAAFLCLLPAGRQASCSLCRPPPQIAMACMSVFMALLVALLCLVSLAMVRRLFICAPSQPRALLMPTSPCMCACTPLAPKSKGL
jgi:hypothetical protein